jgi:hypothetical protein
MSRARSLVAIPAISLVSLAACGGGDDETAATDESATAESTESSAPGASGDTSVSEGDDATQSSDAGTTASSDTAAIAVTDATTTPVTMAPLVRWSDPSGTYRVAFPAEPTEQSIQADLPDGSTLPVTAYLAEVNGAAAITSCVPYPEGTTFDVPALLDSARDGALSNLGAELVDSEDIELQGRPGKAYRGAIGEAGGVLARTFLDGLQLCQALVIGDPSLIEDVAPAVLDSFEFVKEAA